MNYKRDIEIANKHYSEGRSAEALPIYERYAERGNVDCARIAGWLNLNGIGVKENVDSAIRSFTFGADKGDLESKFGLAKCYMKIGDSNKILNILKDLSNKEYPPGIYWLAWVHEKGLYGTRSDLKFSLSLYRRAAKAGHLISAQRERYLLINGYDGFIGRIVGIYRWCQVLKLSIEVVLADDPYDIRRVV